MRRRWKAAFVVLAGVIVYGVVISIAAPSRRPHVGRAVTSAGPPPRSPIQSARPAVGPSATSGAALPSAMWSLPGPSRYEGVAGVGYPHTTLGAVALGYSALAARYTTDPDVAVSVVRATVLAPTTTLLDEVAQGTEALRTRFGLTPTGPSPTTIGLSLVACQVHSATPTRVVAAYEGTLSVAGASTQGTTVEVSAAIALAWNGSDWKIDPTTNLPSPAIAFPAGPEASTSGGWHACAEV